MVPARAQFRVERKSEELPAEGNSARIKDTSLSWWTISLDVFTGFIVFSIPCWRTRMVRGAQFQFAKTHGLIRLIQYVMAGSEGARKEYWKKTITFHF